MNIPVVSYNLLSSHLCDRELFSNCREKDLDPRERLSKILKKLEIHLKDDSVFFLQEISISWQSEFEVFFAERNYNFISAAYGSRNSNYMGIAIAYPLKFELVDCFMECPSDKFRHLQQQPLEATCFSAIRKFFGKKRRNRIDAIRMAKQRWNQVIGIRLKKDDKKVVFGTYHMPCYHGNMERIQALLLHVSSVTNSLLSYADGDTLIFGGDFNFKPEDFGYELMTEGKLDVDWDHLPNLNLTESLKSGYAELGNEPDHTIKTFTAREQRELCTTLDYIFFTKAKVVSRHELPNRDDIFGVYPNQVEPSDHLLLRIDFQV